MKKLTLFAFSVFFILINSFSQSTYELTFTAEDLQGHLQIDSLKISNLSQVCDTTLYWPDTMLLLTVPVGISELIDKREDLKLFQNYPNPVKEQTNIRIYIPEKDNLKIIIADVLGRIVSMDNRELDKGYHFFTFSPGSSSIYFLTAVWRDRSCSIKIINTSSFNQKVCTLDYNSNLPAEQKSTKNIQGFTFLQGDQLLYIAYAGIQQSGMLHKPMGSSTIIMSYKVNIPCPEYEIVEHGGQMYNTVLIYNQCWLKENLNIGTRIDSDLDMTDNFTIEKFCYKDIDINCEAYGGLYEWDEMMQYINSEGAQGICPEGWHIPSDYDWIMLESSVDSLYRIWDTEWHQGGNRGYNAAHHLKSEGGWISGGNGSNLSGFTGLPGGYLNQYNVYYYLESAGRWWTSTEPNANSSQAWPRGMSYGDSKVFRNKFSKVHGFSVRCVKD